MDDGVRQGEMCGTMVLEDRGLDKFVFKYCWVCYSS